MQNDIAKESDMRKQRLQDLDDQMTQDTDICNKFLDNFQAKATNTAETLLGDLEKEIDNRFNH